MTLARRSQFLRGHDVRGKVLWERPDSLGRLGTTPSGTTRAGHRRRRPGLGMRRIGRTPFAFRGPRRSQRRVHFRYGRCPATGFSARRPSDLLDARRPRAVAIHRRQPHGAAGCECIRRRSHDRPITRLVPEPAAHGWLENLATLGKVLTRLRIGSQSIFTVIQSWMRFSRENLKCSSFGATLNKLQMYQTISRSC